MSAGLQAAFKQFGSLRIEWPGKDGKHPRYPNRGHELPGNVVWTGLLQLTAVVAGVEQLIVLHQFSTS